MPGRMNSYNFQNMPVGATIICAHNMSAICWQQRALKGTYKSYRITPAQQALYRFVKRMMTNYLQGSGPYVEYTSHVDEHGTWITRKA